MKYVVLVLAAVVICAGGLFFLNNQSEQREADKKWAEFTHKEDLCAAAKQHTQAMRQLWLRKGQLPTAEDTERWKAQEAQACQQ